MSVPRGSQRAGAHGLVELLEVTRALAAPFDLHNLLLRISQVAMQVVQVERVSVWLLDPQRQELYVEVAGDLPALRVPLGRGLVGACAAQRATIHGPDCYADPRFNAEVDRQSGFHTRCMLSLPLVDHHADLVGVLQLLNKRGGVFADRDLDLAEAAIPGLSGQVAHRIAVGLQQVVVVVEHAAELTDGQQQ